MGHHEHQADLEPAATASEGNVVVATLFSFMIAGGVALFGGASGNAGAAHANAHAQANVASGQKAAVATAAPEASQAALDVLAKGGNAFDAMVSASFVVSVVRPQSTGIGGGGFVVYRDVKNKREGAIDGREVAPGQAHPEMFIGSDGKIVPGYWHGPLSAGVPGLVAMLHDLWDQHGSKKEGVRWDDLLQPAIKLARDGFRVDPGLAHYAASESKLERLKNYPVAQSIFAPGGVPVKKGQLLKQPGLARTLQAIAEHGRDGFYRGEVAEEIVTSANEKGGLFTQDDFANYQVKRPELVSGTYRGNRIISFPPPSSGGVHLIQMLNMLSSYELGKLPRNGARHVHLLAEVMRRAYADRSELLADPDFVKVPTQELMSLAYAKKLGADIDANKASRSKTIKGGTHLSFGDHTTHISIVDKDGNAVASTQTINTGLGSCFVAGDTGVLLNNEMNDFTADPNKPNAFGLLQSKKNLPAPGKRPLSSMTPTIVFNASGTVRAVVGSPGGGTIITTVLQIVSNLIDFNLSPAEAVAAPRVHHQHMPDELKIESALKGLRRELLDRGHRVKVIPGHLGNAQVVVVGKDGQRTGVSDPRGSGRPAAH